MKIYLLLFLFLLFLSPAFALQLDLTVAGNADIPDQGKAQLGVGMRTRWVLNDNKGFGFQVIADVPGSIFAPDMIVLAAWRSGKDLIFDFGAGVRYSLVGGPGLAALVGINIPITQKFRISFPVTYRTGGLGGVFALPYIGIMF